MPHRLEKMPDVFVMTGDAAFKLRQFFCQLLVLCQCLAKADKDAHDGDVDLNGSLAAKHTREHGDALLGEYVRAIS